MKNRASTHIFILLLIVALTAIAHYSIHYSALIRGYETSFLTAGRNLVLLFILAILPIFLARFAKYQGNWTLYTSAVLLFSIGLTVQYRLFSDPEYTSRKDKAEAREAKIKTLQMHYIQENYSAEKKQMMGLPATPPSPVDLSKEMPRPANEDLSDVFLSGKTLIPLFAIACFVGVFILFRRDDVLEILQRNGFLIVLLTLVPLLLATITSKAGKSIGNMTPWEPSKIPFLIGFAAILAILYKNLARTYWGVPRAKDVIPLVFMAILPFVPFFVLKDFGQMMVFSSVYVTLYLIAVRRLPQRIVLVGSVVLLISILVVGALPVKTQEKIPLLPTLAAPVKKVLPDRIQQRFHLWLDGFNPPSPDTGWWKEDYDDYYNDLVKRDPNLPELLEQDPTLQKSINVDAWFDILAFQPAQATFGLASGGATGRGLGLGYVELIPVSDSDYIYAALAEELGLFGGLLIIFALITFVSAGVRTALEARDMFSKLCAVGLTAFIGFQALVNMGGITRALPMTGITLPFVSHGGFSLITSFVMLGMLMAFSHRNAVDANQVQCPKSNV
ncbi:MAG: FtsW/RodA/SpoVE family cell cycle protein [Acidobacteria bacterium]|jgi:cell division protein FtsW (lipid II flippase)|nr:FtsW/RodA/SpoVE family cell cycle protein [Acidobacteriota bacterium]